MTDFAMVKCLDAVRPQVPRTGTACALASGEVWHVVCLTDVIELAARVPHPSRVAGPRAAAAAGEIRAGHGGTKSRETSVAKELA